MLAGALSIGLYLDKLGLKRVDSETPDTIDVGSGHGAPVYEEGPQTRIRRVPIRAIASMTWEDGPERVYGGLENISPQGCLLKTEASIEIGTEVELEIAAIGTSPRLEVEVTGTIRHRTDVDGRQAFGVEFESGDNRELKRLYNIAAGGS